ncbi:putative quinol monooxygenase [Malaciobacter marinus]|uniref:Monooxygenase n=1 Tax=Malaciobacter marinus TaxID=505249 RepID=A0A347TJE2_9BACT|nr:MULTISPECIES: antibiotic biosynthesis monooxygenase [Malaciobacter]AXX86720.1 monooxygenase [Malaciobacter marinus]PHO12932.1 hypothetical protein CPG38_05415 [Malaciobacter marinus]PHO14184.1 hypothetical protein CPH92_13280 [Malaciobacter marinus]RYA23282.1 hypothetical protein CRU96_08435 [Malaciobacter halophilus]
MSLVKQTVYIAKQTKENDLKKLLFTHLLNVNKVQGCKNYEVYEADDDETELLVFEEWDNQEYYNTYTQTQDYKNFSEQKKSLIKREEVLPNF